MLIFFNSTPVVKIFEMIDFKLKMSSTSLTDFINWNGIVYHAIVLISSIKISRNKRGTEHYAVSAIDANLIQNSFVLISFRLLFLLLSVPVTAKPYEY